MRLRGFSLIELLVVVSILAILSSIAVPAYTQHKNRVIVANVVQHVRSQVIDPILINYAKTGSLASSVVVNGVTLSASNGPLGNGWNPISDIPNVYAMAYAVSSDKVGFRLGVTINNLTGLTGYTPTNMPNGNSGSDTLYFGYRYINDAFDGVCGRASSASFSQSIPITIIPNACNCDAVTTFAFNGAPC